MKSTRVPEGHRSSRLPTRELVQHMQLRVQVVGHQQRTLAGLGNAKPVAVFLVGKVRSKLSKSCDILGKC